MTKLTLDIYVHTVPTNKSSGLTPLKHFISRTPVLSMDGMTSSMSGLSDMYDRSLRDFEEQFDVGQIIGRGSFSIVRAVRRKGDKIVFAAKYVEKGTTLLDRKTKDRMKTEVRLLKRLQHPNIIQLHDVFEMEKSIVLVMEMAYGGELFEQILKRGRFEENEAAVLTYQILDAVSYLHSNNIIHRDIKPENLLLKGGEEMIVKVTDFGVAKELQQTDGRGRAFSNVGTSCVSIIYHVLRERVSLIPQYKLSNTNRYRCVSCT